MSHYPVAVFTFDDEQSIGDLFAPYDESLQVAPYVSRTKEQIIQDEKAHFRAAFLGNYSKWKHEAKSAAKHFNPEYIEYLKTIPDRMKWSDEKIYQDAINGREDELNENGDILSTYNPNSKWDWRVIGGRWRDMLITKGDAKSCDAAFVTDIDFEAMQRQSAAEIRPYEDAMKNSYMKEKYMRERYPTEAEYIKCVTAFSTYAVITPNGEWHAAGQMGWWGFSSETPEEARAWEHDYCERFIQPAIEYGLYLTIFDCHI
ncbi:MAG: hypothetical protein LBS36_09700 [Oscillospiraceae bacterium]|jgi:hypothetical protein|nr:hypothetical protein [Oscillospiraceae bacterium]